jgi:dihydrofolate synthase/folylpolyglutamate synthase
MTYAEAIRFWFGRVNYEQKIPQFGDFKLERMRRLLDLLGNPHGRLRLVHVAGSKGKGSTSALLASILHQAGYRVGLFTSPHLVSVEERIQVDRQPIGPAELAALMDDIRAAAPPALERELTFFEIGTALGFLHFVRRRVDLAILEVGLGGRFDSTNVCDPMLSIITSISFDHTQILGDTLSQIAFEKAGIIKPGRPTISGVRSPEARGVIERVCRERGAALTQIDADFQFTHDPALIEAERERWPSVRVTTRKRIWPALSLGLIGAHQAGNAALAIAAAEELIAQGVPIGVAAVADGLARVYWPARLEIMGRRPLVLLDCAHNVASAHALREALEQSFPLPAGGRRILIFAGNQDKDLAGMLSVLAPCFERIFLTSLRNSQRGAAPEQLAAWIPEARRRHSVICADSAQAWRLARAEAKPSDLICVAGSVFLAGELRPVLHQMADNEPRTK